MNAVCSVTGHDVAVLAPDFYKAKIEKAKLKPIVYPLSRVSSALCEHLICTQCK